jgi:hypothetical protein
MEEKFEVALKSFVDGAQKIAHDDAKAHGFVGLAELSVTHGKRYIRVIRSDGGQRSVHCFIDNNGDVLFPAGWKAPAKSAPRGNIFDEHNGLARMGPYGPAYLR